MARGEDKNTIGTKIEDKVMGAVSFAGFGAGGASGLYLASLSGESHINSPEGAAALGGLIASIGVGTIGGVKIASKLDSQIADRIDNLKPASIQDGELYLDSRDPFEIGIERSEFQRLPDEKMQQIREYSGTESPNKFDLYMMDREQDRTDEWIDDIIYGEINGFHSDFKTNTRYRGTFKTGYVDREKEVFVQAPIKGDTFNEAMKRVQTWKENKETLDQADQYLEQVLSKKGTESHFNGFTNIEVDYDFLQQHEDTLRKEVEDGIMTPSENYNIVVTSHNGEPLPVLVGDFNSEMVEKESNIYSQENSEEILNRRQILGMYMDALMVEGEFEGRLGDFWYSESEKYGREQTKNMFYDSKTDTVGVTDIGECLGDEPDHMPDISIEERYS